MYPETVMDDVGAQQGWDDASKLHIALEYIQNQNDDAAFEEFVRQQAADELRELGDIPPGIGVSK